MQPLRFGAALELSYFAFRDQPEFDGLTFGSLGHGPVRGRREIALEYGSVRRTAVDHWLSGRLARGLLWLEAETPNRRPNHVDQQHF